MRGSAGSVSSSLPRGSADHTADGRPRGGTSRGAVPGAQRADPGDSVYCIAMRIEIDGDRCSGHGRCYSLAPDVFDCDDEGYGRVLLADVPPELERSEEHTSETQSQ